jgi:hypothetical protein
MACAVLFLENFCYLPAAHLGRLLRSGFHIMPYSDSDST